MPRCLQAPDQVKPFRYVDNFANGFTRRRRGTGWEYATLTGKRVTTPAVIERLNAIALPPAYRDAWYCKSGSGHILATGVDDRGRRQYRYHPNFRARQEDYKYERCKAFADALPDIRARIEIDLARRDLSFERVAAAVVRLLDLGKVRVGNQSYARANKSFGATTLKSRHVAVKGARLMLDYVGKSGKQQRISLEDKRLVALVKRCQDLPGQALFQYDRPGNDRREITSSDINDYLRDCCGGFTAKDFRTWGASVIAFGVLAETKGQLSLKMMLEAVAAQLGNTPAIARKSYVHPAIIEAALEKSGDAKDWTLPRATQFLSRTERGFIAFVKRREQSGD